MPTITISGPAQAFADDPRSDDPISDPQKLLRFHGLVSEEACADLLDEPPLNKIGLSGGRLRFVADGKSLRIVTTYRTPRKLTEKETQLLVEATRAQWSDGCGSGSFESGFYGTILSTSLAMALLNRGEPLKDLGEVFVDAYPMDADDDETRVVFSPDDAEKTDIDYMQEAAERGDQEAQYQLARAYENGDGIAKNEQLAFVNYDKAAAQGHARALFFVGRYLQRGKGTPRDDKRAFDCFTKAAEQGLCLAMHSLGDCYLEGKGVAADPAAGIAWYRRGVERDDMGCTAQLGDCYESGIGVPQDLRKALELYERCIAGGFNAVKDALEGVKKQLKAGGA